MTFLWLALVLLRIIHQGNLSLAHSDRIHDVALSKKEAVSFLKRSVDDTFHHECYVEGCDFEEVLEDYGYTEKAYEKWNLYQCQVKHIGCRVMACRGHSVGIQNETRIPDKNMKASSFYHPSSPSETKYGPEQGRLNNKDGAWCAEQGGNGKFLQIEFPIPYRVCAVAIQGSPYEDGGWVTKYQIEFSLDGKKFRKFGRRKKGREFSGNTNADDFVKQDLQHAVIAHYIRFVPLEWSSDKPCMRVEVYGKPRGKE